MQASPWNLAGGGSPGHPGSRREPSARLAGCPLCLFPRRGCDWHAGAFGQCREGDREAYVRSCPVRVPKGCGRRRRRSKAFLRRLRTPVQGAGPAGGSALAAVAVVPVPGGGASLVEEVGLEGGGQRQRVDLGQTLLPQGQAHRAAAEVHERQGLGCGDRERGREVSSVWTNTDHRRGPFLFVCTLGGHFSL